MDNLDKCDSNPPEPHFIATKVPGKTSRFRLSAFIEGLMPLFKGKEDVPEVAGHEIHAVKQDASQVKEQLEQIKRDLLNEVDEDLASMVNEVIDPMLRALDKAQKKLERAQPAQAHSLQEALSWTEKAKIWAKLYEECGDIEKVRELIVSHIIDKSIDRIDRDIKFLEDYLNQLVGRYTDDNELCEQVKMEKLNILAPFIESLRSLQNHPGVYTIPQVNAWRRKLDNRRTQHFDDALHAIEE